MGIELIRLSVCQCFVQDDSVRSYSTIIAQFVNDDKNQYGKNEFVGGEKNEINFRFYAHK